MSGKTNITSFVISIVIITLTIFILLPYLDIEGVNKKLNNYQWIIGLFSAVAIVLWGIYSYQNWTFKKEEKSSIQIQLEYLEQIKQINNAGNERDANHNIQEQKINENTNSIKLHSGLHDRHKTDIAKIQKDVEELKKKRPPRKRNNA